MTSRLVAGPALALLLLAAAGCVVPGGTGGPGDRYTINRVSAAEVAIGNDKETRTVNRNTRPGVVRRQIANHPGLEEALQRNGFDPAEIVNVRVRPTNVVDVYTRT